MDYQEAKDLIVKYLLEEEVDGVDFIKAEEIALIALDKQVSKRPIVEKREYKARPYDYIVCPVCKAMAEDEANYCWYCGQRIDWSE